MSRYDRPITSLATHTAEFVTVKALAAHLQCDRRTVMKMIEAGALPVVKVGRSYRIATEDARRAFVPRATASSNN